MPWQQTFDPHDDYRADIGVAEQPLRVLVGQDDEIFHADQFSAVFEEAGRPVSSHAPAGSLACRYHAPARSNPSCYGDNRVIS